MITATATKIGATRVAVAITNGGGREINVLRRIGCVGGICRVRPGETIERRTRWEPGQPIVLYDHDTGDVLATVAPSQIADEHADSEQR